MIDIKPDIFISYSSKDYDWVSTLAIALCNSGYNVWWDRKILPGQNFYEHIQSALDKAGCVITVWSENSVNSHWVLGESSQAQERKILIPVLYQTVRIPIGFHSLHNADLQNWDGNIEDKSFQQLLRAINSTLNHEISKSQKYNSKQKNNRGCSVALTITLSIFILTNLLFFLQKEKNSVATTKDTELSNIKDVHIEYGDLSTSANKRYVDASKQIRQELITNFNNLVFSIRFLEDYSYTFLDKNILGVKEESLSEKLKNEYRDHIDFLYKKIKLTELSDGKFKAFERDLIFDNDKSIMINDIYKYQKNIYNYLNGIPLGSYSILASAKNKKDLYLKTKQEYQGKILSSKIYFFSSLSIFCMVADNSIELSSIPYSLLLNNKDKKIDQGIEGRTTALSIAEDLSSELIKLRENLVNSPSDLKNTGVVKMVEEFTADTNDLLKMITALHTECKEKKSLCEATTRDQTACDFLKKECAPNFLDFKDYK